MKNSFGYCPNFFENFNEISKKSIFIIYELRKRKNNFEVRTKFLMAQGIEKKAQIWASK